MEAQTVKVYGLLLAAYARVEGMKAENAHRLSVGQSIAYGEGSFEGVANYIELLVTKL